jgi:hypothetical protein
MNVPVYTVALVAFALLYLAFSVFLLWTLIITFILMATVLAAQATWYGRADRGSETGPGPSERRPARRAEASKGTLMDGLITAIFIGVTWGIFAYLPPNPAPWAGTGLIERSGVASTLSQTDLAGGIALLGGVVMLTGWLWYRRDLRYAAYRAAHHRPMVVG